MAKKRPPKTPWNKGKSIGQMRPLSPQQVQTTKQLLETEDNLRDLALFATAIDTMLRGVDLFALALTMADVTDHKGRIREELVVHQQKTGKGTLVALTPYAQEAFARWIAESRKLPWAPRRPVKSGAPDQAISTTQYRKLVKKWVGYARLDPNVEAMHELLG